MREAEDDRGDAETGNGPEQRDASALQRGPVVFCAEWADNPDGQVRGLILPDAQPLTASFAPALLNGVETIKCRVLNANKVEQDFTAIPYYAWANRGKGEMAVWLKRE